ncbi:MAG: hypothetical protein U1F49_11475 [Rubrivivax sp.]
MRRCQGRLLGGDIDEVVGIQAVQVAHVDGRTAEPPDARCGIDEAARDARMLQRRVRGDDGDRR